MDRRIIEVAALWSFPIRVGIVQQRDELRPELLPARVIEPLTHRNQRGAEIRHHYHEAQHQHRDQRLLDRPPVINDVRATSDEVG